MRAIAACVDDALRDALVIEMEDLFAEDEVLEQRGAPQTRLETVLGVRDRDALLRGHGKCRVRGRLAGFAAMALLLGIVRRLVGTRRQRRCLLGRLALEFHRVAFDALACHGRNPPITPLMPPAPRRCEA